MLKYESKGFGTPPISFIVEWAMNRKMLKTPGLYIDRWGYRETPRIASRSKGVEQLRIRPKLRKAWCEVYLFLQENNIFVVGKEINCKKIFFSVKFWNCSESEKTKHCSDFIAYPLSFRFCAPGMKTLQKFLRSNCLPDYVKADAPKCRVGFTFDRHWCLPEMDGFIFNQI